MLLTSGLITYNAKKTWENSSQNPTGRRSRRVCVPPVAGLAIFLEKRSSQLTREPCVLATGTHTPFPIHAPCSVATHSCVQVLSCPHTAQWYSWRGRENPAGLRETAAPSPQTCRGVYSLNAVTATHSPTGFQHAANDLSSHLWLKKGMPRLHIHRYTQKEPHAGLWTPTRDGACGPDVSFQVQVSPNDTALLYTAAFHTSTSQSCPGPTNLSWNDTMFIKKKNLDFRDNKSLPSLKTLQFHFHIIFPEEMNIIYRIFLLKVFSPVHTILATFP